MTNSQINLIKRSWKIFRDADPRIVGDAFYSKLFNDTPALRKMFPVQMDAQYRKLIDMLSTIVARLDRPDDLQDELTAMAQRHTGYGVRPAHYRLVGKALLWTLQRGLGPDWNPELEDAWTTCYTSLSDRMINASVAN